MKKVFLIIQMCFLAFSSIAQSEIGGIDSVPPINIGDVIPVYISEDEALNIAKSWYNNRTDVDYYIGHTSLIDNEFECDASVLNDSSLWVTMNQHWLIVVDEEPDKNWSHNCGYIYVQSEKYKGNATRSVKLQGKMLPSNVDLKMCNHRNLYGANSTMKPSLNYGDIAPVTSINSNTYAVILNCASGKNDFLERYWNDCSYIYKVLKERYGVDGDNIFTLMGDNAPSDSLKLADGSGYAAVSHDLDNDGFGDNFYPATLNGLATLKENLGTSIDGSCQLFVFVVGNSGYSEESEQYFLQLWDGQHILAHNFGLWFNDLTVRNISFILGQSMAEGFAEELAGTGRVITYSTGQTESAASCENIPFTEFLYNWATAMHGFDFNGNSIGSDSDENGKITVEEAYFYAKGLETNTNSGIYSYPLSIQEDLAINNIPDRVDLYVRDSNSDTGKEPDTISRYWQSPDIWVRMQPDGIEHQEDEILNFTTTDNFPKVYAYVRVWNRGQDDYSTANQFLHLYWTNLMLNSDRRVWMGEARSTFNKIYSNELYPTRLTSVITSENCQIFAFEVSLPQDFIRAYNYHAIPLNFLARLSNSERMGYADPIEAAEATIASIKESNNIAQHSRCVYDSNVRDFNFYVMPDSLECIYKVNAITPQAFDYLEMAMELSPTAYQNWQANGSVANDVVTYSSNPRKFYLCSEESSISKISVRESGDSIRFSYNFISQSPLLAGQRFDVDLLRYENSSGKLVSGTTVTVNYPEIGENLVPVIDVELENGMYSLRETNIDVPATYEWSDDGGNSVGTGKTIELDAAVAAGTYSLRVASDNGFVNYATVNLDNVPIIESVSPNPFVNNIEITLSRPANNNTMIIINGVTSTNIHKEFLMHSGESQISILTSDYPSGTYLVSVVENGIVLGSAQIIK